MPGSPYTDPPTFVPLQKLTAALLNAICDAIRALHWWSAGGSIPYSYDADQLEELLIGAENSRMSVKDGKPSWGAALPRFERLASSATPTPNIDTTDMYILTGLAVPATFGAPTGTPGEGQRLLMRMRDNGVARALTWNAMYRGIGVALPTTTIAGKWLYLTFIYDDTDSKWDYTGKAQQT
jgi:hypothetical protein